MFLLPFAIASFLVQFFTRFAIFLPRGTDVGFFMMCNLQAVFFSIELRRNLAESKQRKKATDYSVAFFLTDNP
jgi:hypothetical protein